MAVKGRARPDTQEKHQEKKGRTMEDRGKTKTEQKDLSTLGPPRSLGDRLLEDYGAELKGEGLTEEQQRECLLALWQVMVAFVDLGFSVKAGDKLFPESDVGFDDVLNYICLEDLPRETVASPDNQQQEER
ncbi:hypothetical protein [Salipiger bermudensis]|uniref:hypothetical protein n=1 Tax=Salipiger bermudensis TaxID=344736 RepID=UPI001A8FFB38|nr:hypothetical protein [Salipiger bermudensis]MBN9678112.1 hypothetical protein [Salipiger bermudensis]